MRGLFEIHYELSKCESKVIKVPGDEIPAPFQLQATRSPAYHHVLGIFVLFDRREREAGSVSSFSEWCLMRS